MGGACNAGRCRLRLTKCFGGCGGCGGCSLQQQTCGGGWSCLARLTELAHGGCLTYSSVEIRGPRPLIGLVSPGTERHGAVH